jgi:uncharacterized membrane protein YeiH
MVFVGQVYAIAALAGAVVHVGVTEAGANQSVRVWVPLAVVVVVRVLAVRFDLHLPRAAGRNLRRD